LKSTLRDYWRAAAHRIERLGESIRVDTDTIDAHNRKTTYLKMVEIALLVQSAPRCQSFPKWIPHKGLSQLTLDDPEIEICKVMTIEVTHQIRSAEVDHSI
jgi:hypothetical protein